MIENLDDNIGRLVQMLREQGHLASTIIALSDDHSELLGCHGLLAKQRPWEESIGPADLLRPGHRCRRDHRPDLHRGPVSDPTGSGRDQTTRCQAGARPCAADPRRGDRDRPGRVLLEFVSELRPNIVFHDETWRGIRTDRDKYTVLGDAHGGRPWQFFDLQTDPYELENLLDDADHADEIRRHHQLLRDRMVQTYDHYVLAPAQGVAGLNESDDRAEHQLRSG